MTGEQYYAALLAAGLASFAVITLAVVGREAGRRLATRIHPPACPDAADHDTCGNPDCGVALCPWPCDDHQQPACGHTDSLCADHVTDCSECQAELHYEGSDW